MRSRILGALLLSKRGALPTSPEWQEVVARGHRSKAGPREARIARPGGGAGRSARRMELVEARVARRARELSLAAVGLHADRQPVRTAVQLGVVRDLDE